MTTSILPLLSTSSLIYSDDSITPDDMDTYHLPQPPPPLPQPASKSKLNRRSQSFDCLSLPSMPSVMEEEGGAISPVDAFPPPPPASRPSRPSMSAASRPPTVPSRPSLSASAASRRPAHRRSTSTSTSAPTLMPIKLTPNELETNIGSLAATLQDTTSHEWDSRIAALQQLQSIALGCQLTHSLPLFVQHFRQLRQPLCQQIGDLRSSVVRATCTTLSTIAQLCGQPFSEESDAVIPALLRLVAVSVAVIAQSGDETVRAMLRFCSPTRGLSAIIDSARGSTSATTRARCMEYVVLWLDEKRRRLHEEAATGSSGDESRWEAAMDMLIREKLADKTESVRVGARKAAVLYCRVWEESGRRLLDGLDEKVRKLVEEERKRDGMTDDCPPSAADEQVKEATKRAVSTKRRSMLMKAAEESKEAVRTDKENSHPNTTAEQRSATQPSILHKTTLRRQSGQFVQQPISAQPVPASAADDHSPPVSAVRNARRQSFNLVSLVAVDSDGPKRLSGARRVSVAPPPVQEPAPTTMIALPPRPPRQPLSVNARPLAGPQAAAAATTIAQSSLAAPVPVIAELPTPPQSPSIGQQVDLAVVQAAVEDRAVAADVDTPVVAHSRRSRSLPAPVQKVEKQAEPRELPTERAQVAVRCTEIIKRQSVGVTATHTSASTSLIPRRSSFSLPAEHKPPATRFIPVTALLASACEGSWSARVTALDSLTACLSALTSAPRAVTADVESHLDRLVSVLADKLNDSHPRVVTAALSALAALLASCSSIASLPPLLCPHLLVLLSALFRILSRSQQPVKQQCDGLLTALCSVYPGTDLLPPLMSLLSASSNLSAAEQSHAREFALYVCEWGDDELRQAKRNMMWEAEEEKQLPPPRPQQLPSRERPAVTEPTEETTEAAETDGSGSEVEDEVDVVDVSEQYESKYDSPLHEDTVLASFESPPALVGPSPLYKPPPHSMALSPGLARRLTSVLSTQSPPVTASTVVTPTIDRVPTSETVPTLELPVASAHTPPSPPALSFPIHSVFAAARAAITHPASVEKVVTRPAASTSHQRSLSASSAHSAPAARQKQEAKRTQKAKKRISLTAASTAAASSSSTSPSTVAAQPARRSPARPLPVSLSDTDVSALIYQWKHADLPVVAHSLNFASEQLASPHTTHLCNLAIDRIIAAAITLPTTHPTTTPAVVALLSVILSPALCGEGGKDATRLAAHLQTAAFPHATGLVELVVTAHARAVAAADGEKGQREAVEQLWSAVQRYCHRPTLVTAITAQLSTTSPAHHTTLTLLLTSLSTLLPSVPAKAVEAVMAALSHALCLLLCHEQVVVRKQCVTVWVSCWRVLGSGVERWMSGLMAVSRRLVDIYLNKAREEQTAEKSSRGTNSRA